MLKEINFASNINENLTEIKKIIRESLIDKDAGIKTLMKDLAADEGKMLRAIFVLIGGSFGEIEKTRLKKIAASIELLHLATLVHDDIIDESNTRRGRETIHSKFGVKAGLFAGDYLFSQSFVLLSKNISPVSLADVSETIKLICKGEVNQLFSSYSYNSSIKSYLRRIEGKCASLFSLSLSIGAIEGHAPENIIKILRHLGYYTGMAFQIIDDLLDITSPDTILGKPSGNDIKQGIYTLPVLYELNNKNEHLLNCLRSNDFAAAVDILRSSEGLAKSRETAKKYTFKSLNLLNKLPEVSEKQLLQYLVEKMLLRNY